MNELAAVLLGLVQGISEWLPISIKTQVLFASSLLFSLPLAVAYPFGLFMEIGSLGSAIAYFRRDIWSLFHDRKLLVYLFVVTTFTAIVGVPLYPNRQGSFDQSVQCGNPDDPARARANRNWTLHKILAYKTEAGRRP